MRLRFNLGDGSETISLGRDLHNGAWHRVSVGLLGPRVTLSIDNLRKAENVQQKGGSMDYVLGNNTINSYVYIGGLPPWYSGKLKNLALPSVVFEPRFRGEIRNVIYADGPEMGVRQQRMMAYKVNTPLQSSVLSANL